MTFKHGSITTTVLPGGDVRIATASDTLLVAKADLDDAITALCSVRQLQDPEGYERFVSEKLYPNVEYLREPSMRVFRDLPRESHSGTVSAEGRTTAVLDDEDIEGITGKSLAQQLAEREIAARLEEALHRDEAHPDYEYETTQTGRKSGVSLKPEGEGWEANCRVANHRYENGVVVAEHWRNWERFEFHEDEYWKRRKR